MAKFLLMKKNPTIWTVILLALVALCLRLFDLGKQSLWMDEGFSVWAASNPLHRIYDILRVDQHPPFFYAFTHVWLYGGWTEFYLRLPSVICGTFTTLILYFFGKRLFSSKVGFLTALFWACAYVALEQETQVRMYAMATLFSLLSSFYFWKSIQDGTRRDWILYFITAGLALYTHYYSGFILTSQLLFLLSRREYKKTVKTAGILFLIFLPQLPTFWIQFEHHVSKSLPRISFTQLIIFAGNALGFENVFFEKYWFSVSLGILSLGVIVTGLFRLKARSSNAIGFLVFLCLFPSLVPFAISYFTTNHIFLYRYIILFVPYYFLLFVAAMIALSDRFAGVFMLVLFALNLSLWGLFMEGPAFQRQDWRDASTLLRQHLKTGDAVFVQQAMSIPPLWYYLRDIIHLDWTKPQPPDDTPLIAISPAGQLNTQWYILGGEKSVPLLEKVALRSTRQWLVLCQSTLDDPHERSLSWFLHHRREVKSYKFRSFRPGNEIFVILFVAQNKEKQKPAEHSAQ